MEIVEDARDKACLRWRLCAAFIALNDIADFPLISKYLHLLI